MSEIPDDIDDIMQAAHVAYTKIQTAFPSSPWTKEQVMAVACGAIIVERQAERDRCNAIVKAAWGANISIEAFEAGATQSAEITKLKADIAEVTKERDAARNAIAWANNSLFGSHGFFLSMNGGEPDPHHLDTAIEELKSRARRTSAAEAERDGLAKALEPFAEEAACYDPDTGDGDDIVWATPSRFKIRDLRNARAALAAHRNGGANG